MTGTKSVANISIHPNNLKSLFYGRSSNLYDTIIRYVTRTEDIQGKTRGRPKEGKGTSNVQAVRSRRIFFEERRTVHVLKKRNRKYSDESEDKRNI